MTNCSICGRTLASTEKVITQKVMTATSTSYINNVCADCVITYKLGGERA